MYHSFIYVYYRSDSINLHFYTKWAEIVTGSILSEWVIIFKGQLSNFSATSSREQVSFQWNDDEVCFVLDQHAKLEFYGASTLTTVRGVDISLHSDTLFWFRANQSLLFLLNASCLVEKQQLHVPIL
jgi:hypothetical protein